MSKPGVVVMPSPPKMPESHKVLKFVGTDDQIPKGTDWTQIRAFGSEALDSLNGSDPNRLLVAAPFFHPVSGYGGIYVGNRGLPHEFNYVALVGKDGSIVLEDIGSVIDRVKKKSRRSISPYEAAEMVSREKGLPIADALVLDDAMLFAENWRSGGRNVIFRVENARAFLAPGEQFRLGAAILVDDLRAAATEAQRDS